MLVTRLARSSRRLAIAVTSLDEFTTKSVKACWSWESWLTSCVVLESAGLKYLAPRLASAPRPSYQVAEPWMTSCRLLRVLGSSVLKSWSSETGEVVLSDAIVPPSGIFGLLCGPGVSAM